jgi:murein DD-endopeptidase MepM/ murein hydrolase activator NlpD
VESVHVDKIRSGHSSKRSILMRARQPNLQQRCVATVALCAALFCPPGFALQPEQAPPAALRLSPALDSAGSSHSAGIELASPVPGGRISSPFGWRIHPLLKVLRFHKGVDYAAPLGTPVHAAASGVIEMIGRRRDYGLFLRIRHSGNVETGYSHLARLAHGMAVGLEVRVGQVIGKVGRSGWATGPHLDFEVSVAGQMVDPEICEGHAAASPPPPLQLAFTERLDLQAATLAAMIDARSSGERHAADHQGLIEAEAAGPWRGVVP